MLLPDVPLFEQARLQQAAYRVVKAKTDAVLAPHKFNTTQWVILSLVGGRPNQLRIKDLAEALHVKATLVTKLVNQLEQAGLVEVQVHRQDSRARALALTTEGRRLLRRIEPELAAHLTPLETGLSTDELAIYFRVLQAFIQNANS